MTFASLLIYLALLCSSLYAKRCSYPLGMENRDLPDAQITASSEYDATHGPSNGRLNFKAGGGKTGAWSAKTNDVHQWLQVDLGQEMEVQAIQSQGRQDRYQWVKSYTVSYSNDGITFTAYGQNRVFRANRDQNSVVLGLFSPFIKARYIRVHPQTWNVHISMRIELLGCPIVCSNPLGMENKNIPDAQITASSEYNNRTRSYYGRLNLEADGGNAGAWSAKYNNYNQWLQVDLGEKTQVTGIKTQGQERDTCQWVKSYTISYSNDGIAFTAYKQNVVLKGNSDHDTEVLHVFVPPIQARYIRVHPRKWHEHISMRMELLGCPVTPNPTTTSPTTTLPPTTTLSPPTTISPTTAGLPPACSDPLGLENEKITDAQITASTEFNSAHGATNGRLNFKAGGGKTGAWSARTNDVHQWLQVDLGAKTEVTGIQIQGRQDADQWVTSFTISYSSDGTTYTSYQNSKVFTGNTDRNTVVLNVLHPSINARYIRVHPKTWRGHISMRMELLGCPSVNNER